MENRKRVLYTEKCSFIFVSDKVVWCGQPQTQDRKELLKQESIKRGVVIDCNTIFRLESGDDYVPLIHHYNEFKPTSM